MTSIDKAREQTDQLPDYWLAYIAEYMRNARHGHIENTSIVFSAPVLRPSVRDTYPLFIIQYALLAIFSVLSNLAVLVYIFRLRLFYDSTHAFIVNLSICHIAQCVVTLPLSLMVLLIQNWIFGQFLCFFLPFLQDIPLHVSMITHLLIAWDRMRWLSDPLKGRIPAFVCSCATWLAGIVIALPYPIYTAYVDLGLYQKEFVGVGICIYNLIDDMHEYSRGLFIMMYCAPSIVLAYLYIRTSRDLKAPEGPLGVMMFEVRNSIRHKRNASKTIARTNRNELSKAYDLFDVEFDINKDKRAQRHYGAMAMVHILCVCPLMVLKLARMVVVETYENSHHFDLTYLMFVWIAFLPTAIIPWIYASLVLPSRIRQRVLGYFRLSDFKPHSSASTQVGEPRSSFEEESSIMIDHGPSQILNPPRIVSTMEADPNAKYKQNNRHHRNSMKRTAVENLQHKRKRTASGRSEDIENTLSIDNINNSLSNITASTYCINGADRENMHFENSVSPYVEKRSSLTPGDAVNGNGGGGSQRNSFRKKLPQIPTQAYLMEKRLSQTSTDRGSSRKGSTSTLERDMEIIDMLERERSMDIQEMLEQEKMQPNVHRSHMKRTSTPYVNNLPVTDEFYPTTTASRVNINGYGAGESLSSTVLVPKSNRYYREQQKQRNVPVIRRTSYDISQDEEMTDPLNYMDRKLIRTKSSSESKSGRELRPERYRRHSSDKYDF